jgi:hypothetical protein
VLRKKKKNPEGCNCKRRDKKKKGKRWREKIELFKE